MSGKTIAVWGLAFKPNTDDVREAPSLVLLDSLIKAGCNVRAFDPVVKTLKCCNNIEICSDIYEAAKGADAICLVTEWKEFRLPDWTLVKQAMNPNPLIIDGRNIYDKNELVALGFSYDGIGV